MSDSAFDPSTQQPATGSAPIDQFRRLLDILDPPDEVVVTDAFGDSHRLASAVSARAQIKILREFERVKDLPVAQGLDLSGGGGVGLALVMLAQDPEVLSALARCFAIAHPGAVASATESAGAMEIEDAADLFPIEELVAGLVPLFGRLIQRSAGAIQALDGVSQQTSPS